MTYLRAFSSDISQSHFLSRAAASKLAARQKEEWGASVSRKRKLARLQGPAHLPIWTHLTPPLHPIIPLLISPSIPSHPLL